MKSMLLELSNSFVVVEGIHDVSALRKLGIHAYTYEKVMRTSSGLPERALILTDNDRRGMEKAERLNGYLGEMGVSVDSTTGTRLLKMLNSTHVEDILKPVAQALEMEQNESKTRNW